MREQSKNVSANVSIWVERTNESRPIIRIGLRNMDSMTVDRAIELCNDLQKAIQTSYDFQREINREQAKNISIEYLVEKGWVVTNMNRNGFIVKGAPWIAVMPSGIAKVYTEMPLSYSANTPTEAYRNICLWAADTGVDL